MTKAELYQELNKVNHSRENRLKYADFFIHNPKLISPLIEILFDVDHKISCKAAWILELMCGQNLNIIIPYLDVFTTNITRVCFESAMRPVAKICEYLTKAHYSKIENPLSFQLTATHKENITEACFDWMINDNKVATKAYAMSCLFLLGKEYLWIHPELRVILERDFQHQSAAFKARAKYILNKISKP